MRRPYWNQNEAWWTRTTTTMATQNIWTKNLDNFPLITQDIVDTWANESAKIPRAKQQKGYSNFIEGYIHDVEGKLIYCPIIAHRVVHSL
jgi:hypothetical protein